MENKEGVLIQRYELGKFLGQGTFAKVYHARNLVTGMSVAIKMIDKEKVVKVGMVDQIKREIFVMKLVRHPNIVQLFELMASKTKIYFVMEYVKGGELFNKVAKGRLKEDAARKYFQQLIRAIDFCHSRGVYHRDLKPENILLDENGNLKISDFGFSALADSKRQDGLLHTTCGTPAYAAPEVIGRKGYNGSKADIWSCGVILYVLLAGYLPFHDSNLMEMYRKIGKAEFKYPNWFPAEVRKLITKMLDPNPHTRISIDKIMETPWFRKGYDSNTRRREMEKKELTIHDADVFGSRDGSSTMVETEKETEKPSNLNAFDITEKPSNLNAFDIISLSPGFDLSGLFEDKELKKDIRFTSAQPAKTIISKLEDVAKRLRLNVTKKDAGLLKLEASKEGRKGVLAIDAEIFEITSNYHLVELKKSGGDTLEYQKTIKQEITPALEGIVWNWQDDQAQAQQHSPDLQLFH